MAMAAVSPRRTLLPLSLLIAVATATHAQTAAPAPSGATAAWTLKMKADIRWQQVTPAGALLVSTPVGHIKDLGEDAAVLVKPGDPEDVAARIEAIVADPVGWRRRVEAARAWAAAHDADWTSARIGEIIEGLCSTSAS